MTTEHDVVRGLAWLAAEQKLKDMEEEADRHGTAAHIFPSMGNHQSHEVTVTLCDDCGGSTHSAAMYCEDDLPHWGPCPCPCKTGFQYRLRVPACPSAGGIVDRETALRIIASDKALLAAEAVDG